MNKRTLLAVLFLANIVAVVTGAYFKITHQGYGDSILIVSFGLSLAFVVLALTEVFASRRIDTTQKLMWTVGLIFFHTIAALVYLLAGRRHVIDASKGLIEYQEL
ncbi:Phospholipase_D-nuclease N-terminal [Cnuella takakiae]|uniref:Phospholipase_D-nuclease N-terminal n=1 Tax=Cnuella takakiae TaxID=1302690 RepID=A0A1M5IGX1_9BACT|nr:PLDc N-terminal domain-containing protein [Cnuella takakiae]OLY90837.1 hypothetical protein BUE76_02170 [Cnuella takakiae]SHG27180.1 Phospholipase_D-nuclease N-terminal [Cnuella takakiae]